MADDRKSVKRTKCINTWFTPINTPSSISRSETSLSAAIAVGEPQPSECPVANSPSIHFDPLGNADEIQRDPGKRCAIWKYPVNERDSVRRAYISLGPTQPKFKRKEYLLTLDSSGKQQRRFNSEWFDDHPWLEYSVEMNKVYCFPCFLFDKEHSKNQTFTIEGYQNWKKASDKQKNPFNDHVGSINSLHNGNMQKWVSLRNPSTQIDMCFHAKSLKPHDFIE